MRQWDDCCSGVWHTAWVAAVGCWPCLWVYQAVALDCLAQGQGSTRLVTTVSTSHCQGTHCKTTGIRTSESMYPRTTEDAVRNWCHIWVHMLWVMLKQTAKLFLYNRCVLADDIVAESYRTVTCTSCGLCLIPSGCVIRNQALVHWRVGRTNNVIQISLCRWVI